MFAVAAAPGAAACRQPAEPPSPPRGPLDPTGSHAIELATSPRNTTDRDDTTDASIAPDANRALDAASLGFDAGVPVHR